MVTLVAACVLMGLWMRSRVVHDVVSFGFGHNQQAIISFDGRLTWWSYHLASETPYNRVGSRSFDPAEIPHINQSLQTTRELLTAGNNLHELSAPYWSLVVPLLVFSMYLLLREPKRGHVGLTIS